MAIQTPRNMDNYFSRLLKNKGPNYITDGLLTEKEVARSIEIIINDIINGRIDYDKYGSCILYRPVLDTLIGHCRNKVSLYESNIYCMRYTIDQVNSGSLHVVGPLYPNFPGTIQQICYDNIVYYYDINNREFTKYSILSQTLESVSYSHNVYELVYVSAKLKMYSKG